MAEPNPSKEELAELAGVLESEIAPTRLTPPVAFPIVVVPEPLPIVTDPEPVPIEAVPEPVPKVAEEFPV